MKTFDRPATSAHAPSISTIDLDARRPKRLWTIVTAVIAIIALVLGSIAFIRARAAASVTYQTAAVTRGDLIASVTATGTVNPQNTVAVGSQVSGIISEIDADFNTHVRKDDTVLIPYTSALQRLTGQTTVGSMQVSAASAADVAAVQTEATTLLEGRHRIAPGTPDDFSIRNLQDIAAAASSTAATMQLLLAGVAAVSLLVGGIGIMNTMLVWVTERTREIGLRVAVGARRRIILWQFLIEAVMLSTTGGALGVVIGVLGSFAIATLAHWRASVQASAIGAAVLFSALVGVFFGWYPAAEASKLDPIVALRSE